LDQKSLDAYNREAATFSAEWHAQPTPADLHAIVQRFFCPGSTADIGCGSGRDTAWLDWNGFAATGYDASDGLLTQARRLYPQIRFHRAALPELDEIDDGTFTNVLCETVIMHLPVSAIPASVRRLMAILKPGGTLYLSWRATDGVDSRDSHERLYSSFEPEMVLGALTSAEVLLNEENRSASSGKVIRRIVARKSSSAD
jgi:SAM-dependent methyltransferase